MEIQTTQEQAHVPVTVLSLAGDLDTNSYQLLQDRAREAYAAGARYFVVDLTRVPYMSSAGLRALNSMYKMVGTGDSNDADEAAAKGILSGTYHSHHLKLVNPSKRVLDVLKMTGVDMFLEIHPNLKQALASF